MKKLCWPDMRTIVSRLALKKSKLHRDGVNHIAESPVRDVVVRLRVEVYRHVLVSYHMCYSVLYSFSRSTSWS